VGLNQRSQPAKRTQRRPERESKTRRTNPPVTGSRIENATNEPIGEGIGSRQRDDRTHWQRRRKSKTRRTNPPGTRSNIENTTNEPTGQEVDSRKRDERTHRLRVKHPKTQRTNPSAIESNVESSQNRTRQVGSDASFAKRSQFRPNRMLSHELSTVFAHQVWSSLASVVGSCGTGQPASERMAVCSRPSAGGDVREDRGGRVMPRNSTNESTGPWAKSREQNTTQQTVGRWIEGRKIQGRNMATRVGWDFAKRSQLCPNQSLVRELSTVLAHRKWYSLTPKAGMCRTGPQSSDSGRLAIDSVLASNVARTRAVQTQIQNVGGDEVHHGLARTNPSLARPRDEMQSKNARALPRTARW
jgi:hypothetical protein